jgi:carboxylesterase type B
MAEVTLTDAEARAAVEAALSAKQAEVDAKEQAKAAAEQAKKEAAEAKAEAERQARLRKANPDRYVGIWLEGDVVQYYDNANRPLRSGELALRDRSITVGGVRYEHTHEDADGVWMYRSLDRK